MFKMIQGKKLLKFKAFILACKLKNLPVLGWGGE
jgi:hypothetical protein